MVPGQLVPERSRRSAVLLRPGRRPSDPCLTILWAGPDVHLELRWGRQILWCGVWDLEIRLDGQRLGPEGPWEKVLRFCDEEVDYLEVEKRFARNVRVERHILLARRDRFLLLADALLGRCCGRWEYRGGLPLVVEARFCGSRETRDGVLTARRRRAVVLPLGLPECRADAGDGGLTARDRRLELRQGAEGRTMFAPLWLDLDPRRFRQPCTWRQLTVGEHLRAQPPDVAVGYRVAVGRHQWLVYRALASRGNRTVLGHNLTTEMLVARFRRTGKVEPLIEIE